MCVFCLFVFFLINKFNYCILSNKRIFVYISEVRYYVCYLHFSDYCPHLGCHVYHNVSAIVRSSFLQVVGMSILALYFTHQARVFLFHKSCLMDISYLLLISPLKVLHCLHLILNSHSFWYVTGFNNAFIHCAMCPQGHMAQFLFYQKILFFINWIFTSITEHNQVFSVDSFVFFLGGGGSIM